MKKLLMTGAALVAMAASPAMAQGLSLDLAGHFKGYGVYNDNDEATGESLRDFNFRKETEIHFTGETTLNSGLTVGVHVEAEVDADDDGNTIDESYMYLSGGWGRVNFGEEDGAAYLLQVAAPSADSNVDGLRQYINTFNVAGAAGSADTRLDYDHVSPVNSKANKLTYMTPVFNGFQAGLSYIPAISDSENGIAATESDEQTGDYDDGFELAARYETNYDGVGVAFGAGYGDYSAEDDSAGVVDADTWNVGVDVNFDAFGLGLVYMDQEAGSVGAETDTTTWVVGADYQMGAYKLGASYLDQEAEVTGAADVDTTRLTGGVSYAYGPGMSFRGSVSYVEVDNGTTEIDSTQILLGTQVNF